jgi:hypothetical protein
MLGRDFTTEARRHRGIPVGVSLFPKVLLHASSEASGKKDIPLRLSTYARTSPDWNDQIVRRDLNILSFGLIIAFEVKVAIAKVLAEMAKHIEKTMKFPNA